MLDAVGAIGSKGSEGIGQQRPTAEIQPAMQGLLIGLRRGRKTAPRPRNHNPRALWIKARRRCDLGRRLRASRGREHSRNQLLLLFKGGVQRLLEGQVEVNRSRWTSACTLGLLPSLNRQGIEAGVGLGVDAVCRSTAEPAAGREQKGFLVNRLVGAAVFEPGGAIRREQQQGLTGAVRLHRSGKQVGHRGAGGGDHCHGTAMGGRHAEGQKGGRTLIDGRDQLQLRLGGQHSRGCCQGAGTAARAEHQLLQPLETKSLQQREGGLQIGASDGQCSRPGWCDLRSTMTQPTTPAPGEDSKGFWRNLILWALLALLLRWLVVEPRWIPSGSMLPTLQLQDRILVEKVRPRLARSRHGHLHRGDVVVFAPPEQLVAAGYDASAALIKRVVGLPGDQLEVHDGRLFRNGEQAAEPWLAEAINYEMAPITVPADQLWVMGDNRNASLDSHLWGSLPETNVLGTAVWRYWPLQRFGPLRITDSSDGG